MEVKDLIAKKNLLERGITNLINDFMEENKISIDDVNVQMIDISEMGFLEKMKAKVRVRLAL